MIKARNYKEITKDIEDKNLWALLACEACGSLPLRSRLEVGEAAGQEGSPTD